jgi:hypothetical protein
MSFTRFKYDECRVKKDLQQSTDQGRWVLNVPGNSDRPFYMEDPQIIIQKWGGNLRTNTINLESELKGINRQTNRDCLEKDDYKQFMVSNEAIYYPSCNSLYTEQSRATNPAWLYRDLEQVSWQYPLLDHQSNTCLPFQSNLSTRILEKDYYTPKRDSLINESIDFIPNNVDLIRKHNI